MDKTPSKKPSIRTLVIGALSVAFVFMFLVLYLVFSTSMERLLYGWESSNMRNSADLAETVLRASVNHIPGATREWAEKEAIENSMQTGAYGKLEDIIGTKPYQLYRMEWVALLNAEQEIVYQGFYDAEAGALLEEHPNLGALFVEMGRQTQKMYLSAGASVAEAPKLDVNGFIEYGRQVFFASGYPVSRQGGESFEGTLVFGRTIDHEELEFLTQASEAELPFVLQPLDSMDLDAESELLLEEDTSANVVFTTEEVATSISSFTDLYGENTLAVVINTPRTFFYQGISLINTIIAVMTICCAAVLWVIILVINRIVVNPIAKLVEELNQLSLENITDNTNTVTNNKELDELNQSINMMLTRIQTSKETIDKNNEKMYFQANFDALTGLRNRPSTVDMLENFIDEAKETLNNINLYFIDLQRFKFVNDTMGHAAGDKFIIAIAKRLETELGDDIMLSRIGGDEFLICVQGLDSRVEQHFFAEKILSQFRTSFIVKNREVDIKASVGSSVYPEDGQDAETLIKNAETAMYHAKKMGETMYMPYRVEMQAEVQRRIFIENRMRAAINDSCKEFRAYFQPKLHVKSGLIESCEALMRWVTSDGVVGPMEFIPLAEETGLIIPLSWWMIKECYRNGKNFDDKGLECAVSINVSAQVLLHNDFLSVVKESAHATGLSLRNIDVEILESTLVDDVDKVNMVLQTLHSMGAEISVDDFGTGYSSLSYLNKLAVDRIKIDRSFVMKIESSEQDQAIIKAIIAMAKSLNMIVTAEGVETVEQYRFLRDVGCDEIQGYLVSKPVPADDFTALALKWNSGEERLDLDADLREGE